MLGLQLRQRGLRASQTPGALVGQSWLRHQDAAMSSATDSKPPGGEPSESIPSASVSAKQAAANNENAGPTQTVQPSKTAAPRATVTPPQASPSTSAAMQQLRNRLATAASAAGQPSAKQAQTLSQQPQPQHQELQPLQTTAPERRSQKANFLGVPIQMGEINNVLQRTAVLTYSNPQLMEDYVAAPLEKDQRFLEGLAGMKDKEMQQRAAYLMRVAEGLPPPAALVWASQEVVRQVRRLVRDGLQQQRGGAAPLHSELWYEGAVKLARLVVPRPASQTGTDLDLLRAFADPSGAHLPPPPSPAPEGAAAPAAPATQSNYVPWEALLSLPQLRTLLDAASAGSPALETTLELTGLRPASAVSRSAAAEPGPSSSAASAGGSATKGGAAQRGKGAAAAAAGPWLLPVLRAAVAAAKDKALREGGLLGADGAVPLKADAVLTALALGHPPPAGVPAAAAKACGVAAEWLAAVAFLRHAEEQLGCAGGAMGVRQDVVAVLQLLDLPLEPSELAAMEELKVSEEEVQGWISKAASQLTASAVPMPPALASRLDKAHQRLAANGRALALLSSPDSASSPAGSSGEVAGTAAWLRTVGTSLVSGLLSGGYDRLGKLRAMVPELKESVVLRLLESGKLGGGVNALTAALYGDAAAAWRTAQADVAAAPAAAERLREEALAAELDLVHERFVPPLPQVQPPPPLPTADDLAKAIAQLPPAVRQVYDSYSALHPGYDGGAAAASASGLAPGAVSPDLRQQLGVLAVLGGAGDGAATAASDGELQAWLTDARKGLLSLKMSPALLSLLVRFIKVQVAVTPEAAATQRNKLMALMTLVAQQQHRAAAAREGQAGAGGDRAPTAAAAAQELGGGQLPAALQQLLGAQGSQDFASWLQALALTSQPTLSTHGLLAQQTAEMDVERYLTMTHAPQLSLPASGLGPSAPTPTSTVWTDPALRRDEGAWLEDMRPQLEAYLAAMDYRTLGDAEWQVYKEVALAEWEAGQGDREARAAAAGESGFWNPRADEVFLSQMLEHNILPDDPLGPQSRRYLDTLIRNSTWTFAQRKQAVQRLIQLNSYFVRQPPAPEGGSPFAPLFAAGGPDVVPRLGPLEGAAAPAAKGGSSVGAGKGKALKLPPGF